MEGKDIFEDIKKIVGCENTSDLLNKKEEVRAALNNIQFADYGTNDIIAFYDMIFGSDYKEKEE